MIEHVFAGQPLDRMDHVRGTTACPEPSDMLILALTEDRVLLTEAGEPRPLVLKASDLGDGHEVTFLGCTPRESYGFVSMSTDELEGVRVRHGGRILPIRAAAQIMTRPEASTIAYAHALAAWQARSRFCGSCGAPSRLEHSGHRRVCDCGSIQFPRTDPSVIGILTHGDHCLLVSQPQWPPGRFATVAGFVEPGESLEEAMAREIAEEVGLQAAEIRYHSSQPWPFPMSLMIGFEVELDRKTDPVLSDEIREARWFTRDELRAGLRDGTIGISTPMSISFALIASWYGHREELEKLAAQAKEWR